MNRYRIINTVSGSDLGIFDAADEQGALDAMAREAGYKDVMGAKVRARRCSIRSPSERRARSSAVFWHPNAERYGRSPNLPGVLPLLLTFCLTH